MALLERRSLAVEILALVALGGALACGGDEPARDQAVFWIALSAPPGGGTCSSFETFDAPNDGTARGITTGGGAGERLVDGDDGFVECVVAEGTAADQYNLSLNLQQAGDFGSLSVTGVATGADATLNIALTTTTAVRLEQNGCTATVREALSGAVWLTDITCPTLGDPSSPGIRCVGTGGMIAENCSR